MLGESNPTASQTIEVESAIEPSNIDSGAGEAMSTTLKENLV